MKAIGKTWHKGCLRCKECNTPLDSTRLTEKDGDPLCHRCYSKVRLSPFFLLVFHISYVRCSCTAQQEMAMLCSARPVVRHVCRRLGTPDCTISTNFHCHINGRYVFLFTVFLIFTNCCFPMSYYCTATHFQLMVYQYLPLSPLVFAFTSTRL